MDLIVARPEELYCAPGDFYIDPWRPEERGEELVTDRFPELADLSTQVPNGTVLDGEIVVRKHGHLHSFASFSCAMSIEPLECPDTRLGNYCRVYHRRDEPGLGNCGGTRRLMG